MFKKIGNLRIKTLKNQRGFTLIELLVVIAIIAILAAIAIPMVGDHLARAAEASMLSDARSAATAIHALHVDAGLTFDGLSPAPAGPGPVEVTWTITPDPATTPPTFTATTRLSAGNTISVHGTPDDDNFTIVVVNGGARDDREAVAINQAGAIGWGADADAAAALVATPAATP